MNAKKFKGGQRDEDEEKDNNLNQSYQVDNSSVIVEKVAKLFAERLMSDVELVVNGQAYPCHRLILCASSDVFQVMLMNQNWAESKEQRIQLRESRECAEYFEDFLKYLYTGKIRLELDKVLHILTLADKYNVKDLISLSLSYMEKHIPSACKFSQLIHWYRYTCYCSHIHVEQACRNFIKWNFEMVSKTEDFQYLDLDLLTSILEENDIVVFDEFSLLKIVDNWINCQRLRFCDEPCQEIEKKMLEIVKKAIGCIRFPMLSPRQLADLILSPLVQKYKESLLELMAIGMSFHSLGVLKELVSNHPSKAALFTPRLYCSDKWSINFSVDNFGALNHYQSKTIVFSTPLSFSEKFAEKPVEWICDLYPKGVWFLKHFLIIWQGTVEVPEHIMQTIRLSIHCKNEEESDIRMKIGVLIAGVQDGIEHVRQVKKQNFVFSPSQKILNIDNLLPYDELIQSASVRANPSTNLTDEKSPFLVGENRDSLKIRIIITPMTECAN